jgi:hypothetical protein
MLVDCYYLSFDVLFCCRALLFMLVDSYYYHFIVCVVRDLIFCVIIVITVDFICLLGAMAIIIYSRYPKEPQYA